MARRKFRYACLSYPHKWGGWRRAATHQPPCACTSWFDLLGAFDVRRRAPGRQRRRAPVCAGSTSAPSACALTWTTTTSSAPVSGGIIQLAASTDAAIHHHFGRLSAHLRQRRQARERIDSSICNSKRPCAPAKTTTRATGSHAPCAIVLCFAGRCQLVCCLALAARPSTALPSLSTLPGRHLSRRRPPCHRPPPPPPRPSIRPPPSTPHASNGQCCLACLALPSPRQQAARDRTVLSHVHPQALGALRSQPHQLEDPRVCTSRAGVRHTQHSPEPHPAVAHHWSFQRIR